MKDFRRLAHALWECKYHIVWCPKYRFRLLKGEIRKSIRDIVKQLCEWKQAEILEGSVQIDHIHLVLSIPPKYSVSEFVGFLKGKSAIKIFDMLGVEEAILGQALLGKRILCEHGRTGRRANPKIREMAIAER